MEDVEICYRIKKAGFSTLFFNDVSILHKERGSSNKRFAILNIYKGVIYFYKKHKPFWQYFIARMLLAIKALISFFIGLVTFNKNLISTYKEAFIISI
jgi:GT2 family glycosyltransferase